MCTLQIINDIEPLSLTLDGVNAPFIHHPSNVKKLCSGEYIFTPLYLFWTQKSKYKWPKIFTELFGHL